MPQLSSLRQGASLLDLFKAFPDSSKPLIHLNEVLLRGPSPFTKAERELIATFVSHLNRCGYCQGVHAATAERLGIGRNTLEDLAEGVAGATIPERMKPVLSYAEKLTDRPDSLVKADADAILEAGWDETAIYHTVAVTALFNFMNRLVEGLGIEYSASYAEQASKRLAEGGYLPLIEMLDR
ncbi:MAG: peroxidase-related enzyme [Kiloniellaceae bacterium]